MNILHQGSFTRGSQLYAHKFRMFGQGLRISFLMGLLCTIIWLFYRLSQKLTFATIYYFVIERYVQLKLAIGEHFYPITSIGIKYYSLQKKAFMYLSAKQFVDQFWRFNEYGENINQFADWGIYQAPQEIFLAFFIGIALAIVFFAQAGRNVIGMQKLRGGDIVDSLLLAKTISKAKEASKITISGLPLVKDSETQHLLLTGTTGSGKTNMLNELLPQIRNQSDRAIIFDLTGGFVRRFRREFDTLLNPFSLYTASWLPWNDCSEEYDFDALASAFIDGEGFADKYWEEASQKVFSVALQKFAHSKDIDAMLKLICNAPLNEFCDFFSNTLAASLVSKEAEKGTASVRATLLNKIARLKYLKPKGDFSIKDWVNNSQGWLFITAPPNQRDTLKPLVSAWIDIAIKGLMEREDNQGNSKMWFVLDELPALQKIPSLKRGLAEGRKYGGCFVAGIQNIFQIEEIYGHAATLALLDMFNTRFFFKVGDQRTAEYASKSLGEKEMLDTKESLSYGADSLRDGVSINSHERTKILVMPTEILTLPPRVCFVRLSGNYPITKLHMKIQN